MMRAVALAVAALAVMPAPAQAREQRIVLAGGTLADAAIALARATGTSIIVADSTLARRSVAPIKGTMEVSTAVRKLAKAAGARAVQVGPKAWRIEADPRAARPFARRRPAPPAPPPPAESPQPLLGASEGEPIVVIASKRDATLGELPGQVSLLDGAVLERGGVGGTEKITQQIATVSSTYLGSGRNKLFIRGIADSSFTGPTQATVGQYLGDLRLSYNAPDPDLRLSDLERVEVLEGPQGTLYGAGSLGGIIRLVPRSPEMGVTDLRLITGGSLTQHGEPGADLHATFNLGGSAAALRMSVDTATLGGYIDKPALALHDVNRTRIYGGRLAGRVEIAPDWSIEATVLGQRIRAEDSQYAARDGESLESPAQVIEGARASYLHGQTVISGMLGSVRLRSTTGIAVQRLAERYDATAVGEKPRLFTQQNDTRMFANETRAWQPMGDRLGWVAGLSYIDNKTTLTRSLGPPDAPATTTGVTNTVHELTGYGEASLRLYGPLIASAGVRVTHTSLGGEGEDVLRTLAIAGAAITANRSETAVLPSASLLLRLGPQARSYIRYQEGFRPGGLAISGDFVRQFRSDQAATVEIGGGIGEPRRGAFDFSASLAQTRWRNIQADFIDDTGLPTTANIGDGTIWTASASGSVRLSSEIRVKAGASFNDSKVEEPELFSALRVSQVPNIARFSGRFGLDWTHKMASGLTLDADGWVSYIGKSRLGVGPELGALQGDYLDSGARLRIGRERFGLTVSLTNLADVEGNRFALGTPFATGRQQITPLQPRTIRIGLDTNF